MQKSLGVEKAHARTAADAVPGLGAKDRIDSNLFLKDLVFYIIYEAATLWAEKVAWRPDEEYL